MENKSAPSYEIELEIWDTKFFNQPDYGVYLRLVERFIQNISSLMNAINEGEEMFYNSVWQPEFEKLYKEFYETDILPVVGDYLATKAFSDKMI